MHSLGLDALLRRLVVLHTKSLAARDSDRSQCALAQVQARVPVVKEEGGSEGPAGREGSLTPGDAAVAAAERAPG